MTSTEPKESRIVYIHIGMSKAGSSAIQKVLMDNSKQLLLDGFIYPQSGLYEGAHYEINEQLMSGAFPDKLQNALLESKTLTPILSCEGFWLLGDQEVERVSEVLSGYSTRVIVYLRNPCGYMPSSFRQSIKEMGRTHNQHEYLELAAGRMNYSKVLQRWGSRFELTAAVYDQHRRQLVANFLNMLGLDADRYSIPAELVNATPPDGAIQAMRLINILLQGTMNGRPGRLARGWIRLHPSLFSGLKLGDQLIQDRARDVPLQWDMQIMRKHLSEQSLEFLLKGTVLDK